MENAMMSQEFIMIVLYLTLIIVVNVQDQEDVKNAFLIMRQIALEDAKNNIKN